MARPLDHRSEFGALGEKQTAPAQNTRSCLVPKCKTTGTFLRLKHKHVHITILVQLQNSANNPTKQYVLKMLKHHVCLLVPKINLSTEKRGRAIASPNTWLSIDTRLGVSGPDTERFTPKYIPRLSQRSTNSVHKSARSGIKCTSPPTN